MSEFKRERRYAVIKLADIEAITHNKGKAQFAVNDACSWASDSRELQGKPPLECLVIESDWPEYEPVWRMIENRMTGKAALSQQEAEPSGSVPQGLEEFIAEHEGYFDEIRNTKRPPVSRIDTGDLRTWMAGHARVPVEVVSHYDALQFLIEPLKAAKGKGMTAQEACAALSAWDKARNIKGAASREGAIPDTHRVVSVGLLENIAQTLGKCGYFRGDIRAIIDSKEQQ